ncbi:MAG: HNH endonuclease [Parcubacteria group bacterium]
MSPMCFRAPLVRGARQSLGPVGHCIYCFKRSPSVVLSDEHIIPDGLAGDLVLRLSSCDECASKTCSIETHFLREVLQFARAVVGVQSRKRKSARRTIRVTLNDGPEPSDRELPIDGQAPFILPFITTDALPGILRGGFPTEEPRLRLSLFGAKDWNLTGQQWLGANGTFRWAHRLHAGIVGQALAKIAHAYACAKLGADTFTPFLTEYIRAKEPPFDGYHLGSYSSHDQMDCLHYLDIQLTRARRWAGAGYVEETLYVVYLRLFAHQPSPSFLIVVGRPKGQVPQGMLEADFTFGSAPP